MPSSDASSSPRCQGDALFIHPVCVETNTDPLPGGRDARDWWLRKVEYQRQFRFTIAFENVDLPGYTSEKSVDGLLAGTIPVYWGNPEIADDVEPTSIINACSFNSWEELADYVVYLDDNRELARPFFEPVWPLRIDLDKTRDAVVDLFERALDDRRLSGRILRAGRPWIIGAARVRTIVRRSTTTSNT